MRRNIGPRSVALLALAAGSLLGCGGDGGGSPGTGLADGVWHLAAFLDDAASTPALEGPRPWLQFHADFLESGDSLLLGNGGCGDFAASWTVPDAGCLGIDLAFREMPSCGAALRAQEDSLLARLAEVSTFQRVSDSLWLRDEASGRGLLLSR
jgi:hypothetical protein